MSILGQQGSVCVTEINLKCVCSWWIILSIRTFRDLCLWTSVILCFSIPMGSGVLKVTVLGSSLPALNFMLASAQGQMSDIALGGTLTQLSFCFHVLLCVFSFKKINHMTRVCFNSALGNIWFPWQQHVYVKSEWAELGFPDWNISATLGWIGMLFGSDIHGSQR